MSNFYSISKYRSVYLYKMTVIFTKFAEGYLAIW